LKEERARSSDLAIQNARLQEENSSLKIQAKPGTYTEINQLKLRMLTTTGTSGQGVGDSGIMMKKKLEQEIESRIKAEQQVLLLFYQLLYPSL
jgi:hypothetical protein